MAINEAVNIGINVDGTASVKDAANAYEDLGDAVAKTQLEAERLANTYGINDQRTQEAIKVAGKYKQQMEELDFAIDGARGGVDQMFRATQGIVAGFEVAAGAAALFGGENEELEKTLMKVQGAMVFAQGLKDLKEFAPAIQGIVKGFGGPVLVAITAASAGIYALVNSFKNLKNNIGLTEESLKKIKEQVTDSVAKVDRLTDAVKDESLSEKERLSALRELQEIYPNYFQNIGDDINNTYALENAKKRLVDSLINEAKIKALQDEIANTYKDSISEEIRLTEEINKYRDASNKNLEILNTKLKQGKITQRDYNIGVNQANQFNLRAVGLEKELNQLQEERQKKVQGLSKIINDSTNIVIKNGGATTQTKQVVEKSTKAVNDNTEAIRKNNEEMAKFIAKQTEVQGRAIKGVTEVTQANLTNLNVTLNQVEARQKSSFERLKLFVSGYGEDLQNTLGNVLEVSSAFTANMSAKATQDYQKRIDKLKELGYTEEEISNMRDSELEKIDKRGKQAFEIQKKLQYAQTLLSTIQGTQEAFTSANKSPLTAIFPAYPYLQAAAAAAFGLAQLQQISQSSYESKLKPATAGRGGGGAASVSGGGVPTFQAPRVQLGVGGEQFTQANRVYVTEADISNTQNKVKVTEGISSF